jgi:hypothetical protein
MKSIFYCAFIFLLVLASCKKEEDPFQKLLDDSSLVLYLPFDNDIKDEGVNNLDVFNNGVTLANDKNNVENNAGYFNGIDNYLMIDTNLALNEVSISLWIYPSVTPQDGSIIFKTDDFYNSWGLFYRDSVHILEDIDDSNKQIYQTPIDEDWNHIVAVLNNDLLNKMYVNGNLVSDTVFSSDNWSSFLGNLYIGQRGTSSYNGFFKGYMDEIMLFKRELSYDEVKTLYR